MGITLLVGFVVALLAALESHVPWISAFCGLLGDGCQETEQYRMLGLPIAGWGMAYFVGLGLLFMRKRSWLFGAVMAGVGFEALFVQIMLESHFVCVFCAVNFGVVLLLLIGLFDRNRIGQMGGGILLSFTLAGFLVSDGRSRAPEYAGHAVLAIVGDLEITTDDVERPLTSAIHALQQQLYGVKKEALNILIENALLEQEAARQELRVEDLMTKIRSHIPRAASHVVNHYYDSGLYRQWGSWKGSESEIKAGIQDYLHNRDSQPRVDEYILKLREVYPVDVLLKAPPLPATQIRIEGAPSQGPADAAVVVVELSDYHCPACRKGHGVVAQVREKYKDRIRWVFKDHPLKRHPVAKEIALAARYVHEQGQFWAYQELLFSGAKNPSVEDALAYVETLGMDSDHVRAYIADPEQQAALEEEILNIREAGINTTPSFIINGKLRPGMPTLEEFCERIDQALDAASVAN